MDIIQSFSDRNLGRYTLDNKYTRHLQDVSPIPLDGGYIVRNNIQDVPKTEELSEAELINMDTDRGKLWAAASKVIYDSMYDGVNALTIKEPESEQDYGRFGVEFMGQFDHNMSMMGYNVAKLQGVDERTKLAMHHMMTEFGQLPMFSWNGAYRVTKGMFTDPTTYASLGTLGLGFLGRAGVKQTTKQGFKEMLRRGITNPYAIAALEGGAYTGMYDYLTQEVNIEAGVQDDVNLGQLATATGTGMVAGPAIVGAGELAVKGAKKLMPGQGDLFDEPTPTSGAPLSAENLEASAVQKFAFYKNKEGGQEVGNKQIIVDIDENIFENHVRPLLDKGMTYEEFEMGKMPGGLYENMHAAFTSVNGGDYKLTKVDDLNNLQPDQTYAIQVDDFNSPDAVTRRQTADSDVIPLGDNIAKFEPPTDDKPGVVAFHGSGADFDEFSLEKIGTGEGAQAYGYGLYFTDSEDIAKFYKESVGDNRPVVKLDYDGDSQAAQALPQNLSFDDVDGYRSYDINDAKTVMEAALYSENSPYNSPVKSSFLPNFLKTGASVIKMKDGTQLTFLKNQDGTRFTVTPHKEGEGGKMYKVAIAPKPEDMLNYQLSFAEQPDNVKAAVRKLGYDPDKYFDVVESGDGRVSVLSVDALGREERKDFIDGIAGKTAQQQADKYVAEQKNKMLQMPMPLLLDQLKTIIAQRETAPRQQRLTEINAELSRLAKEIDKYTSGYRQFTDPKGKEFADQYDALMAERDALPKFRKSDAEKILSELLLAEGVPGVKYRAAGSRGANVDAADAKMNYVIFDDKAIKILEKYGVVGPVAVTALASQQTQDDDARVANAPKI